MHNNPEVSIVIPAHNEAQYLPTTLKSVQEQTFQSIEVIIVCNGCSDGSMDCALRCYPRARMLSLTEANVSIARNEGAKLARGRILAFLDADTRLSPTTIQSIVEFVQQSQRRLIGTALVRGDASSLAARVVLGIKNGFHRLGIHITGSGIIFCERDLFLASGGFDPSLHSFEHSTFISRFLKKYSAKYVCVQDYVTTSMRRYVRTGYFRVFCYWLQSSIRFLLKLKLTRPETIR